MMLKVYEHPLSPYAQKVKLALHEKGIAFEAVVPNLFGKDPEFEAASPRREVPALIDGDVRVFDSTIILDYLEDKWPSPSLLPQFAADRARVRMIEDVCDTYYEAINWGIYEIRFFGRAPGKLGETMLARASEQHAGANRWLERELGDRQWFDGERFGRGDVSVFPYVNAAATIGDPPTPGSRLAEWLERCQKRDSARKVVDAATASMGTFTEVPKLIQSGAWQREYRDHRLEWMMRTGGRDVVLDGLEKGNIRFTVEP